MSQINLYDDATTLKFQASLDTQPDEFGRSQAEYDYILKDLDGAEITSGSGLLKEAAEAMDTPVEGTVDGTPAVGSDQAGPDSNSYDAYDIDLATGHGSNFSVGDYIRKKHATAPGRVFYVAAISTDTLSVLCADGDMDIADTDTIEKVEPWGIYQAPVSVDITGATWDRAILEVNVGGSAKESDGNYGFDEEIDLTYVRNITRFERTPEVSGGSVDSVTGAVGSVTGGVGGDLTGDVKGNVDGSVASVTGGVGGDLTGDVKGNVDGSVASVTGGVGGDLTGDVKGNVDGSVASVTAPVTIRHYYAF